MSAERAAAVEAVCPRRLYGHGRSTPADDLTALADEASRGGEPDRYGEGGVVTEVEEQVRDLLGAEAAVLLPSGTMAQQIALRVHADRTGRRAVAMHPSSHPLLHEEGTLAALHGLTPVAVGRPEELVTIDELLAPPELAAVLLELPQRETGGQLMAYDGVAELSARCRAGGTALHLDGARLWECGPAYARPLSDLVALADSTYVSLYKGLAGVAGAILLGDAELVAAARIWRRRHGGTLPSLWPLALGARRGLREHLPRMPDYVAHAVALAAAIGAVAEVPTQPVTPLFHVVLPAAPEQAEEALLDVAEESGVFLGRAAPGPREGTSRRELYAGAAALEVTPEEAADLFSRVVAKLG
ncbi:MAG: Low-specificity L-threonine aldolase [Frankiales bacterium]|nr:Low-specificity L-threonine aldolase [Frankiales bacterium]